MSFPSLMCDYPWLEIRPLRVFLKFSLADFYRRIHKYSFMVCRFLSWLVISLKWRICSFPFNAWCRYNLMISLRSSLPLLNGIIFPPAPEFVQNRIFPFIAFCVEPYLNRFRSLITPHASQTGCKRFSRYSRAVFPYSLGVVDLAVFPAFLGIIFIMASTQAVGMELSDLRTATGPQPGQRVEPRRLGARRAPADATDRDRAAAAAPAEASHP